MNSKSAPTFDWIVFGLAFIVGIISILAYLPGFIWLALLGDACYKDEFEFFLDVAPRGWVLYPIFPLTGLIGSRIAWKRQHTRLAYFLLLLTLVPYLYVYLIIWLSELGRTPCRPFPT